MVKIYKINEWCKINTNNPTPSKADMDIAINIEPLYGSKNFQNFVLAIDNHQQCCEWFGTVNNITKEKAYVESIEVDTRLNKKIIDYLQEYACFTYEEFKDKWFGLDYFAVKVNIRDEEPVYGVVFNAHNGYYSHCIYYSSDELKIDVYENNWI